MWRSGALVAAVCAAAALAGCGSHGHRPAGTFTAAGDVVVVWLYPVESAAGDSCASPDGYRDIQDGAQVTVADAGGKTVALGHLGAGGITTLDSGSRGCDFPFSVTGVPRGQKFYSVQVANRDALSYSASDLTKPVQLTLGNG